MHHEKLGRVLCFALRHKPQAFGITLDAQGFADVDKLIASLNKQGHNIMYTDVATAVELDEKSRFQLIYETRQIRAVQGHSVVLSSPGYDIIKPEVKLYHGTNRKNLPSILKNGLNAGKRSHVHLSSDYDTAVAVGKRYGDDFVVLSIDAPRMVEDGLIFYHSLNLIFLIESVDKKYITEM